MTTFHKYFWKAMDQRNIPASPVWWPFVDTTGRLLISGISLHHLQIWAICNMNNDDLFMDTTGKFLSLSNYLLTFYSLLTDLVRVFIINLGSLFATSIHNKKLSDFQVFQLFLITFFPRTFSHRVTFFLWWGAHFL